VNIINFNLLLVTRALIVPDIDNNSSKLVALEENSLQKLACRVWFLKGGQIYWKRLLT